MQEQNNPAKTPEQYREEYAQLYARLRKCHQANEELMRLLTLVDGQVASIALGRTLSVVREGGGLEYRLPLATLGEVVRDYEVRCAPSEDNEAYLLTILPRPPRQEAQEDGQGEA